MTIVHDPQPDAKNDQRIGAMAAEYVRHGWKLCAIPKGAKGPQGLGATGWNRRENAIETEVAAKHLQDGVGLQHLWSRTCALDFDNLPVARAWLLERGTDANALLNAPAAVRIASGRPDRAKVLYRLPAGVEPLITYSVAPYTDSEGKNAKALEFRCAARTGNSMQDALPPTKHPKTGKSYYWEYGDDLIGDWRCLPVLPASVLTLWQSLEGDRASREYDGEQLTEITENQLADLRSALAWGPLREAAGYEPTCAEIGHALLSLGPSGRELWLEFCLEAGNWEPGWPEKWWNDHESTTPLSDFRSVYKKAAALGWTNPYTDATNCIDDFDEIDVESDSQPESDTAPVDSYETRVDMTDTGNANLLIKLTRGDLRVVPELKRWLWWDGRRWIVDTYETFLSGKALLVPKYWQVQAVKVRKRADATADKDRRKELNASADALAKFALRCRNRRPREDMLDLAKKTPGVPLPATVLDRNPWTFGVDNGVVDLRTGELHEAEARDDYVTKRSPYAFDPDARAPLWERFIEQVTGAPLPVERDEDGAVIPATVGRYTPRPALAEYVQRMLGYCLTGSTREHKLFIALGEGANGKNVLFDTFFHIVGPYALKLPAESLLARKQNDDAERPTALAASLAGVRCALASETAEGQSLNANAIKNQTGDAHMTARRMRENPFTFEITHKTVLFTNHRPALDHLDVAIRGRLHLIPFDRRWNRPGDSERSDALPNGDKDLPATLKDEAEGILAWLVRGAVAYCTHGLTPPAEVVSTTRGYFLEQDHLGRWLAECCERCLPKVGATAGELFAAFEKWCAQGDVCMGLQGVPGSDAALGLALKRRPDFQPTQRTRRGMCHGWRIHAVGVADDLL